MTTRQLLTKAELKNLPEKTTESMCKTEVSALCFKTGAHLYIKGMMDSMSELKLTRNLYSFDLFNNEYFVITPEKKAIRVEDYTE